MSVVGPSFTRLRLAKQREPCLSVVHWPTASIGSTGSRASPATPARAVRSKQWTGFSVFCERLRAALREEFPNCTAGCDLTGPAVV